MPKLGYIVDCPACGKSLFIDIGEDMFHVVQCPTCGAVTEFDDNYDGMLVLSKPDYFDA